MATQAHHPVVILYAHALLGEGIARYLRAQIGVEATVVSTRHPEAVRSALALGPSVVIFESNGPFELLDLAILAPHTVLIDVSAVITRGSALAPCAAGLEQILAAVRDSSIVAGPSEPNPLGVVAGPTGTEPLGALAAPTLSLAAPTLSLAAPTL